MKGIYLSQDLSHAGGIEKKIFKQIELFENNSILIDKHINKKRSFIDLVRNTIPFFSVQYFKTSIINWKKYDFAYIRKGAIFDKSVIKVMAKAKRENPSIRIIVEIPTYPYLNEFKGLLKLDIKLKELRWTHYLSKYVDRFITYSDDQMIFNVPCINISNAYDFDEKNQLLDNGGEVHLLGVAALCFYHGYDRVIEGMRKYYSAPQETKVYFTLVGDGPVLSEYKEMVKQYNLEEYINFTGRVKFSKLNEFYRQADIGIDSLGRHRSGVTYNSSLKGKEYLAKGIPAVSGVKTDLDNLKLPFYFRVPADESPVNITEIVCWYKKLRSEHSKAYWAEKIFEYGKENFSFENTFMPVIDYLKKVNEMIY